MESQSDIQRLQTACQELLKKEGAFYGFLRRKTILHKLCEGFAEPITSRISWQRRYFVVYDGFLYNYKSETDNRPAKVIDLCAFQRVERDENLKVKGVPWPLRISSDIPNVKVLYFGATSEPELMKWIEAVKNGIDEAKQSGRQPVTVEKKDRLPKMMKMPKKQKSQQEEGGGSDNDVYSAIDDEPEDDDYQSGSDYSSIDGHEATAAGEAETKASTISRNKLTLPRVPDKNYDPAKGNTTDSRPSVSTNNPQTETARKTPPKKKPDSNVTKKPLPKEEPEKAADLVGEATWTGTPEGATETMKSIEEDGVFMLRESTTGKGELTLQVISDDAVRKYRITKEGRQFRIAGGNEFDSMADLLSFYQNNSIPNHTTKLTKPYSKV